jgi:hypothetical protein
MVDQSTYDSKLEGLNPVVTATRTEKIVEHTKLLLVSSCSAVVEQYTLDSEPNSSNTAATAPGRDKRVDEIFKAFWPAKVP